jgi:hypothetical protein
MRIILVFSAEISILVDTISLNKWKKLALSLLVIYHCPLAERKQQSIPNATLITDIFILSRKGLKKADIVISMLPAHLLR